MAAATPLRPLCCGAVQGGGGDGAAAGGVTGGRPAGRDLFHQLRHGGVYLGSALPALSFPEGRATHCTKEKSLLAPGVPPERSADPKGEPASPTWRHGHLSSCRALNATILPLQEQPPAPFQGGPAPAPPSLPPPAPSSAVGQLGYLGRGGGGAAAPPRRPSAPRGHLKHRASCGAGGPRGVAAAREGAAPGAGKPTFGPQLCARDLSVQGGPLPGLLSQRLGPPWQPREGTDGLAQQAGCSKQLAASCSVGAALPLLLGPATRSGSRPALSAHAPAPPPPTHPPQTPSNPPARACWSTLQWGWTSRGWCGPKTWWQP